MRACRPSRVPWSATTGVTEAFVSRAIVPAALRSRSSPRAEIKSATPSRASAMALLYPRPALAPAMMARRFRMRRSIKSSSVTADNRSILFSNIPHRGARLLGDPDRCDRPRDARNQFRASLLHAHSPGSRRSAAPTEQTHVALVMRPRLAGIE